MSSMHLSLGDAEGLGDRKRTRREVFLAEMDELVPWKSLLSLIEPPCPNLGRPGHQPYSIATMLRFAKIGDIGDVPDETTILNFRRLLETHGLAENIFRQVNAYLALKGLTLCSGTIVDAAIISAPSSTKNADGQRDPEMHQTNYFRWTGAPVSRRGKTCNFDRVDAISRFIRRNFEGSADCSDPYEWRIKSKATYISKHSEQG